MTAPLLELAGLEVHFPIRRGLMRRRVGEVRAVDGVDLALGVGETVALVGESGCGKTTTGNAILGLVEATGGAIRFEGSDLRAVPAAERRRLRRGIQIVFQDPFASFDPRMAVGESIGEPLIAAGVGRVARRARAIEVLEAVGLGAAHVDRHPHAFSGGQRQRLAIARALALAPKLIVCDEPVSALDVSIRAQVLNLLAELQRLTGVAYLFVSHDLSVVRHVSDRVAVMYLGRIVEEAPTDVLFARPSHPYTRALIDAIPLPDPARQRARVKTPLIGEPPSPARPPSGCRFRTRCPLADVDCAARAPALVDRGGGHRVACHKAA
jgi:oligopeptide/dipeptide ABC transporter ATP-binding protein